MKIDKIKAVLIDDEIRALENLAVLLEEFCPHVRVIGQAKNVDLGTEIINKYKPDVVFLDIEMPEKSGFELFENTTVDFQTIFITAYDDYAVRAFEVSALDYLLKPINIDRLQKAIEKIDLRESQKINIKTLTNNISSKEIRQINVLKNGSYKILNIESIICVEADGAYSIITYEEKNRCEKLMQTKSLGFFEKLLSENDNIIRVHRSWLINTQKVIMYSLQNTELTFDNDIRVPVSRNNVKKVKEALSLKA